MTLDLFNPSFITACWYVGGMVSGFLLCLVWLNDKAER